jgi:hypothetical protein
MASQKMHSFPESCFGPAIQYTDGYVTFALTSKREANVAVPLGNQEIHELTYFISYERGCYYGLQMATHTRMK